jgi:hypothetical protein
MVGMVERNSHSMKRLVSLFIFVAVANPLTAMAQEYVSPDAKTLKALV